MWGLLPQRVVPSQSDAGALQRAPFLANCWRLDHVTVDSNPQDLALQGCDMARTSAIFKFSSSALVKKEAQKEKAISDHTQQDGGRAGT